MLVNVFIYTKYFTQKFQRLPVFISVRNIRRKNLEQKFPNKNSQLLIRLRTTVHLKYVM